MAKKKPIMTNAMRILDAANIRYKAVEYETDGTVSDHFGEEVAKKTGIAPEESFKTLVARGERCGIIVVCIPVNKEVNLKRLAAAAGDKRVELIHVKELPALTGYIRGGVSPIGMKKKYPTFLEMSCISLENVAVSAGVCGCTLLLSPDDLLKICEAKLFEN